MLDSYRVLLIVDRLNMKMLYRVDFLWPACVHMRTMKFVAWLINFLEVFLLKNNLVSSLALNNLFSMASNLIEITHLPL